ncbi:unnamed protein product [Owenia fusiformis]|uniref:Sulfotransferase domain-containing protein n=1 Tax=Owenia fusiformis TaxID=6347 RepID=A0A8J1T791_OWEFU|nr:unnamed protein product [Owenia fusiformis]
MYNTRVKSKNKTEKRLVIKEECQSLHYHNGKPGALALTALASFPGSGSSWFRHLIHQLTGIYTGSVNNTKEGHTSDEFQADGVTNNSVIAIETNEKSFNVGTVKFERTILLVRDPFVSILADFNRRNEVSHIVQDWESYAQVQSYAWQFFMRYWLEFSSVGPLLVVEYENLGTQLEMELLRLAKFLNVAVDQRVLHCILKNANGRFGSTPSQTQNSPYSRKVQDILIKGKNDIYGELHKLKNI